VLRIKTVNPDIVIPANYYNEYALLVRTMRQQAVKPMAVFSVLGGAASSFKFVDEFPDVASGIIDVNHWYNPKNKDALALRKKVEAMKDQYFTYEVFLNYETVYLLADALERAKSAQRDAIIDALASSSWDRHFMPYGPTKFVNSQNTRRAADDPAGARQGHQRRAAAGLRRDRAGLPVEGLSAGRAHHLRQR
jgi:branched-chain amino acid transport system substrate-binding protein